MRHRYRDSEYLPTPYEIQRACEEIQRSWSDRERLRRFFFAIKCPKAKATCVAEPDESLEPVATG